MDLSNVDYSKSKNLGEVVNSDSIDEGSLSVDTTLYKCGLPRAPPAECIEPESCVDTPCAIKSDLLTKDGKECPLEGSEPKLEAGY